MSLNVLYIVKTRFPALAKFDRPIDNFQKLSDGNRILGNSTTWPGLLVAVFIGAILSNFFSFTIAIGIITGVSVYTGHAIGSFIKRRFNYNDGQYMPFVDHADYVIFSGFVLLFTNHLSILAVIVGILITYIVHPVITYIAFLLKLHKFPQ